MESIFSLIETIMAKGTLKTSIFFVMHKEFFLCQMGLIQYPKFWTVLDCLNSFGWSKILPVLETAFSSVIQHSRYSFGNTLRHIYSLLTDPINVKKLQYIYTNFELGPRD